LLLAACCLLLAACCLLLAACCLLLAACYGGGFHFVPPCYLLTANIALIDFFVNVFILLNFVITCCTKHMKPRNGQTPTGWVQRSGTRQIYSCQYMVGFTHPARADFEFVGFVLRHVLFISICFYVGWVEERNPTFLCGLNPTKKRLFVQTQIKKRRGGKVPSFVFQGTGFGGQKQTDLAHTQ